VKPLTGVFFACFSLGALGAPPDGTAVRAALIEHLGRGVSDARSGEWVSYRFDGGDGRVSYWRLAVVGEEKDRLGRDAAWIEVEVGEHPAFAAPLAQMRMLAARTTGLRRDGVTRLFVAHGADPAVEVSPEALPLRRSATRGPAQPTGGGSDARIRTGRAGRIMTPAGTILAVPVELMSGGTVLQRLWMSRSIPVLHLAKMELLPIGHLAEVVDYGFDARPRMILPDPKGLKIAIDPSG
jgi:hypothetical protein